MTMTMMMMMMRTTTRQLDNAPPALLRPLGEPRGGDRGLPRVRGREELPGRGPPLPPALVCHHPQHRGSVPGHHHRRRAGRLQGHGDVERAFWNVEHTYWNVERTYCHVERTYCHEERTYWNVELTYCMLNTLIVM